MSESTEDTKDFPRAQQFADLFFIPDEPPLSISFGGASHAGLVRSLNEDHFAVVERRRSSELLIGSLPSAELSMPDLRSHAMVVADGMGGMQSGERASRLALQKMLELASQAGSWVMKFSAADVHQIERRVEAYVHRVHAALQEQGQTTLENRDMGTTWTSLHLLGRKAVVVHLGDSRAYLWRNETLCQLTRDETMAQALVESGMERDSVKKFNHVLLNAFGGGADSARAVIYHLDIEPGDWLFLCTDGLTDMVSDDAIAETLRKAASAQATCDELIDQALANGGKDNVTVTLAAIDGQTSEPLA